MSLARKTASGAFVNALSVMARLGVQFLVVLPILARSIPPEGFGIMAMAMTFVALMVTLNDFGISASLVRATNPSPDLWSTAFWTNSTLGFSMTALAFFAAPSLASFYGVTEVTPLAQAISVMMLLQALYIVPVAWLQRELRFSAIAAIDVMAVIGSSAIALTMVVMGFGVWALVGQQIGLAGLKLAGVAVVSRAPLGFVWRWAELRPHLPFSLRLTATSVLAYIHRNSDNILIGRFLGAEQLGLYTRAYQLMMLPQQMLSQAAGFALLPAMSRMTDNLDRLGQAYLKVTMIYAMAVFPLMAGLAALSEPFVRVLLGEAWLQTAPLLSLLALAGIVQTMNATGNVVWTSLGQSEVLLRWAMIRVPVYLAGFSLGVWAGSTVLMAAIYLGLNLLLWVPASNEIIRRLNLPSGAFLRNVAPPAIASAVMAAVLTAGQVLGADWLAGGGFSAHLLALLGLTLLGAAVFLLVLFIGFRRHLSKCQTALMALRRPKPDASQ